MKPRTVSDLRKMADASRIWVFCSAMGAAYATITAYAARVSTRRR
jgi:hypothetical protein